MNWIVIIVIVVICFCISEYSRTRKKHMIESSTPWVYSEDYDTVYHNYYANFPDMMLTINTSGIDIPDRSEIYNLCRNSNGWSIKLTKESQAVLLEDERDNLRRTKREKSSSFRSTDEIRENIANIRSNRWQLIQGDLSSNLEDYYREYCRAWRLPLEI